MTYNTDLKIIFLLFNTVNHQFFLFLIFLLISFVISIILVIIPQILSKNVLDDKTKMSSYECGFDPFSDARITFDIQYYILGILFILFDIEVFFIFAWTIVLKCLSLCAFASMLLFLFVLMIGFIFEWKAGLLDWS